MYRLMQLDVTNMQYSIMSLMMAILFQILLLQACQGSSQSIGRGTAQENINQGTNSVTIQSSNTATSETVLLLVLRRIPT